MPNAIYHSYKIRLGPTIEPVGPVIQSLCRISYRTEFNNYAISPNAGKKKSRLCLPKYYAERYLS